MSNPIVTSLLEVLPQFEGNYNFMYLDSQGHVTCGIGHLLSNVEVALKLPWKFDGDDATETTVRAEWARVTGAEKGHTASFYGKDCLCELPTDWAIPDCTGRLESHFLPVTQKVFHGYECYPLIVQVALLDMSYNLDEGHPARGEEKATGLCGYPNLIAYCGARHWDKAALECHRLKIQKERNDWTKNQFLAAAKLV